MSSVLFGQDEGVVGVYSRELKPLFDFQYGTNIDEFAILSVNIYRIKHEFFKTLERDERLMSIKVSESGSENEPIYGFINSFKAQPIIRFMNLIKSKVSSI